MQKNFDEWNSLKQNLDREQKLILFKEQDIWWCSLSLNIGSEENGKNEYFSRPVLIIRKFNQRLFLGVPLTTQIKENKYYQKIIIKGKTQCAMISQLKVLESKRLRSKMTELSSDQFRDLRRGLSDMILEK